MKEELVEKRNYCKGEIEFDSL